MVQIIDKKVNLEFPLGHHLHCLIAQIPNHLRRSEQGFALVSPERKWAQVESILRMIAEGAGNLKKLHFLMLPETSIPFARFDDMLAAGRPEFVVAAVSWPAMPVVVRELVAAGVHTLGETPPAPELDGLRALWTDVGHSGLVSVAGTRVGAAWSGNGGRATSAHLKPARLVRRQASSLSPGMGMAWKVSQAASRRSAYHGASLSA